jgi:hypothetical protein
MATRRAAPVGLRYLLEVPLARAAVTYYAEHDAWLPSNDEVRETFPSVFELGTSRPQV